LKKKSLKIPKGSNIRTRKSKKNRQQNYRKKRTKGQTTIYKTYTERSSNTNFTKDRGKLRCSERVAFPAPHVASVVLLLLQIG